MNCGNVTVNDMPRPRSKTSKKPPHLSVAVTGEQLQHWTRVAEQAGFTVSAWVRFTLDEAAADIDLDNKGGNISNEEMREHIEAFNRRMLRLLDKRRVRSQ